MRDRLAESLLVSVCGWDDETAAKKVPMLEALASLKYDRYQQYSAGQRFIESLALWLRQFPTLDERRIAYDFVLTRLIYISDVEMRHLVDILFPDFIRPALIADAAQMSGLSSTHVGGIVAGTGYRSLLRQCLFLGLSDGARMDIFRRSTRGQVSHEQILGSYEVTTDRAKELKAKLAEDLTVILGRLPNEAERRFRYVYLLDDFSASGSSYLRTKGDGYTGKVNKVLRDLSDGGALHHLVDPNGVRLKLSLYVATEHAVQHLHRLLNQLTAGTGHNTDVMVVQLIPDSVRLAPGTNDAFGSLIDQYYDPTVETSHTGSVRYGYKGCALPVVLHHNTPNNTIALFWAESEREGTASHRMVPLFPRISRHTESS